jgi:signal transduction histidine kinase/DNA-binding response OmpR family regulator
VSLLLTALLTYWIINTITSRINGIAERSRKIADRELSVIDFKENFNDELTPISESLSDILESFREVAVNANEIAKGDYSVKVSPKSEKDFLGIALNKMSDTLAATTAENRRYIWLTEGQNLLNEKLRGDQSLEKLVESAIVFLCEYTKSSIGALYLMQDNGTLHLSGRYAFTPSGVSKNFYSMGEGLPGQAAVKNNIIHLTSVKQESLRVTSTILDAKPENIVVVPFSKDDKLLGVIEVGKLESFSEEDLDFIKNSMQTIGIIVSSAISRKQIEDLLEETQRQAEELQVQQEELKQSNEELEEHTQSLKRQQEELQVTNEELEEQSRNVELKNRELETAKLEIEKKSHEVEMSSRYKSQFLANMSHELRTPLNSLLILSKDLSENKKKNLDETQIESANIIYKSGRDLLQLINEVLDLSKIEAGKMDLNTEDIEITTIVNNIQRNFSHIAEEKGLKLDIKTDALLPSTIHSDLQRLDQVLKNLVSNAIKFTEKGAITVSLRSNSQNQLEIEVKDSGIGIPEEQQTAIFEAFQQADGSTSRKYGGTGLGLSISRQLAKLLGGEIRVKSKVNEGSVFTFIVPLKFTGDKNVSAVQSFVKPPPTIITKNDGFVNYISIPDDRETITEKDKSILVIEDDLKFAAILLKQAREKGFKVLIASTGEDGLILAEKFNPKAIILDMGLPGIEGRLVLNELKADPSLRHIPVHIISAMERTLDPIKAGAVEYLVKPVDKDQLEEAFQRIENFIDRKMKNLLIVEDDENSRKSIKLLIGNGDVKCFEAGSGKEALQTLNSTQIDCIVLDLGLPDISGFNLIKKIQAQKGIKIPPVIVYTGKDLTKEENDELQNFAESIIIKGVKSEERLLDETALFLHRTINSLPDEKKEIIRDLYDKEAIFHNKKILIADDDMRNVFALSKVLKEHGMEIIKAENGIKAVEAVIAHPDLDLVLMDVMMPEMDGLEAIRKIREKYIFKDLPILSLTAKAMKEDRKKCIDAGANDYISKPIELERLLSLMKIWIRK